MKYILSKMVWKLFQWLNGLLEFILNIFEEEICRVNGRVFVLRAFRGGVEAQVEFWRHLRLRRRFGRDFWSKFSVEQNLEQLIFVI